jgi:hypothetical protein
MKDPQGMAVQILQLLSYTRNCKLRPGVPSKIPLIRAVANLLTAAARKITVADQPDLLPIQERPQFFRHQQPTLLVA